MKKLYLILIFLGIYSFVKAQPQINQSNYAAAGDTYAAFVDLNVATWAPGTSGPGQVWDFSAMTGFNNATFTYSLPSATPYNAAFSTSDIALNPFVGQYSFFLSSSAIYEISGTVTNFGTAITRPYTNPQTIVTFPFTFSNELKDTAETADYNVSGGNHQQRTIYSQTLADAYGDLTVPGGTVYSNVLRIRITSKTIDSTYNSSDVFLTEDISIDTNYYWVSPDLKPHVFSLAKSVQDPTGAATTTIIAQYFSAPTTETGIYDAYNSYFSVYPNPISSELYIRVDENIFRSNPDLIFSIINAKGIEVMKADMKSEKITIARGDLASGLYYYTVRSKDKILNTGKLSVQ